MSEFEKQIKIRKWEWIPFIGTLCFIIRFELYRKMLPDRKLRNSIGKYRGLWSGFLFLFAIPFIILLIIWKVDHHPFVPWYFWIGFSVNITGNILALVPHKLYIWGFKAYNNSERINNESK